MRRCPASPRPGSALHHRHAADFGEERHHQLGIAGRRVDAGADGGGAEVDLSISEALRAGAASSSPIITAKAENSWPSVIGTASCSCVRPIFSTLLNSSALRSKAPRSSAIASISSPDAEPRRDPQRRRIDVVRALRRVDVIVRVQHVVAALLVAEVLERPVGDDLVGVHVGRRAGAALDHVDDELVVQLAARSGRRRRARSRRHACGRSRRARRWRALPPS